MKRVINPRTGGQVAYFLTIVMREEQTHFKYALTKDCTTLEPVELEVNMKEQVACFGLNPAARAF